jgi:branched-chain amino acid aminotransferase
MEANAAGADDALMLDGRGFVAETNATHLFAVVGGALHTPRTVACPEGITRQTVLELAATHGIAATARDISLTEFYAADEAFCTGTMGEIAGVTRIDGRSIGDGEVGPVTQRVAALYRLHASSAGTLLVP